MNGHGWAFVLMFVMFGGLFYWWLFTRGSNEVRPTVVDLRDKPYDWSVSADFGDGFVPLGHVVNISDLKFTTDSEDEDEKEAIDFSSLDQKFSVEIQLQEVDPELMELLTGSPLPEQPQPNEHGMYVLPCSFGCDWHAASSKLEWARALQHTHHVSHYGRGTTNE